MENCALCGKYLKTQELQEQSMCNDCDDKTNEVAKDFNKLSKLNDKLDDLKEFSKAIDKY